MTPRERVYASIRRRPLDALPWQFDLTAAVAAKLKNYYATDDLLSATGDHVVCTGLSIPDTNPVLPDTGLARDEFGAVWRREARDRNYGDWGELVSYSLNPGPGWSRSGGNTGREYRRDRRNGQRTGEPDINIDLLKQQYAKGTGVKP